MKKACHKVIILGENVMMM